MFTKFHPQILQQSMLILVLVQLNRNTMNTLISMHTFCDVTILIFVKYVIRRYRNVNI